MVAGLSYEEACELVGHNKGTNTRELVAALRRAGFRCSDRLHRISRRWLLLPQHAIVAIKKDGYASSTHWIVYWEGKMYDPEDPDGVSRLLNHWTITSYLEIEDGRK
jgi:hypothetical protein